jgi:CheY-like chemotaxis protein
MRFALQRLGKVEILEAANGVEGLKILRQGGIDLALVDINMPVMDGLKMTQMIRQDPHLANLPIIIITTEGKEEIREKARELGIEHYVTKPINQSQVVNTVRGILQIK